MLSLHCFHLNLIWDAFGYSFYYIGSNVKKNSVIYIFLYILLSIIIYIDHILRHLKTFELHVGVPSIREVQTPVWCKFRRGYKFWWFNLKFIAVISEWSASYLKLRSIWLFNCAVINCFNRCVIYFI